MPVKNVEGHAAEHGIPQRGSLLENVPRRCLAPGTVPRAPFVHDELDAVLTVEFTHDLPVPQNEVLHTFTFAQNLVPVHGIKLNGVPFSFFPIARSSAAKIPRVMVKPPTVDAAELRRRLANNFLEEAARPAPVIRVRTRGDQRQRLAVVRQPSRISAEFNGILLRRKVSSTPPGFISYTPVAHVIRLRRAGLGALLGKRGAACRRIAVLHPPVEFRGGQAANVGGEVWLRPDEFAEMDKLVGAEFVGIILVIGRRFIVLRLKPEVRSSWALIGAANTITPVIAVSEASTRVANDGGLDLPHVVNKVLADAIEMGDLGFCADPHAIVDGASQVLREVAVEVGRNSANRFVEKNFHSRIGTLRRRS